MKSLIIGIGSSGLRIIEELQQYHYEYTGKNKPENSEYLYIETDVNRNSKKTASGTSDIDPVYFDFKNIQVDINILKDDNNPAQKWVPDPKYLNSSHSGAGGMPVFGRLSLWKTQNYTKLCNILQQKFQKIKGDAETKIIVLGTLTGGTCSGMCVDLAYLLHMLFPLNIQNTNALFLAPKSHKGKSQEVHAYHENFFSAITAITHYNKLDTTYKSIFPGGTEFSTKTPPFQLVHLLSTEFNNGDADISSLDELYKLAGFSVMLRILGSDYDGVDCFQEVLDRRDVDRQSTANFKFVSSGIKLIQYPKGQLKELLSIELGIDEFLQLIDSEKYLNHNGTSIPIESVQLNFRKTAQKDFEDILTKSFDCLDGIQTVNEVNISDDFKFKLNDIESLDNQSYDVAIFKNFSSSQRDNYFQIVKDNKNTLINTIIESIASYIEGVTNNYKNLQVTKVFLNEFCEHISSLIEFYEKEYNITGNDDSWDSLLGSAIEKKLDSQLESSLLFQKKDFRLSIFTEIFMLLKIHLSISILIDLREKINSFDEYLSPSGIELPTLKFISKLTNKINSLINGNDDNPNMLTLHKRKSEINSILNSSSTCYEMLFENREGESDISEAKSNLYRKGIRYDLKSICNNNIWKFITNESDFIYSAILKNTSGFVNENEVFSSNLKEILNSTSSKDVKEIIKSNSDQIREELPALLNLVPQTFAFNFHHCSHLHFISSDNSIYLPSFKNLKTEDDGSTSIPQLTDTIVFYQEYEQMSDLQDKTFEPISHLLSFKQTKRDISSLLSTDYAKEFLVKKSPYLTDKEFKDYLK